MGRDNLQLIKKNEKRTFKNTRTEKIVEKNKSCWWRHNKNGVKRSIYILEGSINTLNMVLRHLQNKSRSHKRLNDVSILLKKDQTPFISLLNSLKNNKKCKISNWYPFHIYHFPAQLYLEISVSTEIFFLFFFFFFPFLLWREKHLMPFTSIFSLSLFRMNIFLSCVSYVNIYFMEDAVDSIMRKKKV